MARDPYPSETQDRFLLRMPDGMRDRLKAEAEANKRSMNAEIVARLEASLSEDFVTKTSAKKGEESLRTLINLVESIYDAAIIALFRRTSPENAKQLLEEYNPAKYRHTTGSAVYQVLLKGYRESLFLDPEHSKAEAQRKADALPKPPPARMPRRHR